MLKTIKKIDKHFSDVVMEKAEGIESVQNKFYFKYPFGGMTPYPPTDCKAKRILKDDSGVRWCDNYFCATICAPKYCKENREYSNYLHFKMNATATAKENSC